MTQAALAVTLGALFAAGTYLLLRRDVVRVVLGLVVLTQAANLYLVAMGGLDGLAPVGRGVEGTTDPLVQALVLTAIVIGFATTALALVVVYRVHEEHGTVDLEGLRDEGGWR